MVLSLAMVGFMVFGVASAMNNEGLFLLTLLFLSFFL